jgi:hypothetical protein
MRARLIEIEKNVPGIAMAAVEQEINVEALTVACTKKAHHASIHQVTRCLQPFFRSQSVSRAVNQTDEVEIIRHTLQLAPNSSCKVRKNPRFNTEARMNSKRLA